MSFSHEQEPEQEWSGVQAGEAQLPTDLAGALAALCEAEQVLEALRRSYLSGCAAADGRRHGTPGGRRVDTALPHRPHLEA